MKIKIEDIGSAYRIYELAYVDPIKWPNGQDFIVSYENIRFLFNERQIKELESGEIIFKVSSKLINNIFNIFKNNPKQFSEDNMLENIKKSTDGDNVYDTETIELENASVEKKF
jgi:hypothetical protein